VPVEVIVLNGGSSSGKSTIARGLQSILAEPWLTFGVDTLIDALPPSLQAGGGIEFGPDGQITVGPAFRRLEAAWIAGVAAMARAEARIIIDEAFLGGARSQQRWREGLDGLSVLWVGVRCDVEIAARRERGRTDRIAGMARSQAALVHRGVGYDLEVDTSRAGARECALAIAAHVR
jgi:chloramphenicol 3-O phosphotransferase